MEGKIIKAISGFYYVSTKTDGVVECRARGRFRKEGISPLVGDEVDIMLLDDGSGMLESIHPRRNEFVRPAVANLDQLVVLCAAVNPVTEPFLIDRVTAIAGHKGVDCVICVNKADLDSGDRLFDIYKAAGFKVIRTSAETGEGVDELIAAIRGKTSAFTGNSGVGKSSILNCLEPRFSLPVGEVSVKLGRGRHTTRHVELFELSCGATVADTPGFSAFDTERMDLVLTDSLQYAFSDFAQYIEQCRFIGCSHTKEDGCAVIDAVNAGLIQKTRYESYCRLYESAKEVKKWEIRHNGSR